MKTIQLQEDTWHYWLVCKSGWNPYWGEPLNFCQYTRRVVGMILLFIVIATIGLLASGWYLTITYNSLRWLALCLFSLEWVQANDYAIGGIIINTVIVFGAVMVGIIRGWIPLWPIFWPFKKAWDIIPACREIPMCEDTKEFFGRSWESVHDKVCFKLEFVPRQRRQREENS